MLSALRVFAYEQCAQVYFWDIYIFMWANTVHFIVHGPLQVFPPG